MSGVAIALGLTWMPIRAAQPSGESTQAQSDGVQAAVTDTALTGSAKAKLMATDGLGRSHIHVTTENGTATLTGTASSAQAKSIAENAVRSVDGIKDVDNRLTLQASSQRTVSSHARQDTHKTERVVSDSWITTKVKSELLTSNVSQGVDVSVKTTRGTVTLTGEMASQSAIDNVRRIAEHVNGVKHVDVSALTIGGR